MLAEHADGPADQRASVTEELRAYVRYLNDLFPDVPNVDKKAPAPAWPGMTRADVHQHFQPRRPARRKEKEKEHTITIR